MLFWMFIALTIELVALALLAKENYRMAKLIDQIRVWQEQPESHEVV